MGSPPGGPWWSDLYRPPRPLGGLTQVTFDLERHEIFAAAEKLRPEWSVSVEGEVVRRLRGNENPELPTGEIEVEATDLEVLNASETPPFEIERDRPVDESLRLKYRYLDLRRPRSATTSSSRHEVVKHMRDYLDERDSSRSIPPANPDPPRRGPATTWS